MLTSELALRDADKLENDNMDRVEDLKILAFSSESQEGQLDSLQESPQEHF